MWGQGTVNSECFRESRLWGLGRRRDSSYFLTSVFDGTVPRDHRAASLLLIPRVNITLGGVPIYVASVLKPKAHF